MIKLILKEDKASISGNQQFIKKNVIAMLRKVGISKMKADTLQVPEGEITLSFDANPEQKEQLKQLLLKKVGKKGSSKRAKLHFIDTLKEMIREELNESVLYEAKYKQTYKSITARDKDSRRIWGSQIGHPRVTVRSWSEVEKTGRMKTAYIEVDGDKVWVDAYKKIAFKGNGTFGDVVKFVREKTGNPNESLNESVKMHTISGNKRFMTKTALPILRKYGLKNVKVNNVAGDFLEIRFAIDSNKLKKIDKELKRKNKTAYGGIVENRRNKMTEDILRKVIREEIKNIIEEDDSAFDQPIPAQIERYMKKFINAVQGARLNRRRVTAILGRVVGAMNIEPNDLMRYVRKVKKGL